MSYDAECYCKDLSADERCVFCEIETGSRLTTLAHNLAWGAALCRAFDLGEDSYVYATGFGELTWRPGCGEQVP